VDRIEKNAGSHFQHGDWPPLTYQVPGAQLEVTRDGHKISRPLSLTDFRKASACTPAAKPSDTKRGSGMGVHVGDTDGPTHQQGGLVSQPGYPRLTAEAGRLRGDPLRRLRTRPPGGTGLASKRSGCLAVLAAGEA
jgi:hypothetical protein